MVTLDDCLRECQLHKERFANALDSPGHKPEVRAGWRRNLEIYTMLEKMVVYCRDLKGKK